MRSALLSWSLAAPLALGLLPAPSAAVAAEKGKAQVETVAFHGWEHNLRLSNGETELIVTLDVGPRILSYRREGGKNVLKLYDEQLGKSGESGWMIRGGHRLWASPEDPARTYHPDNAPVQSKEIGPGAVRLTPPPESKVGLQKEIDVALAPSGTGVTLTHRIRNIGQAPTSVAPWALTVMAPGGVQIIPIPEHKPHPGGNLNASAADFGPAYGLILWPYADFTDKRLELGSKFIRLHQDRNAKGPIKIGLAHRAGWVAYLNDGELFVKSLRYEEGRTYPDLGANYETFTNFDMMEMENLGPLQMLKPGEQVELVETWSLAPVTRGVKTEADIEAAILPLIPKH